MLKEFVEAIAKLAIDAGEPKIIHDQADPRVAYLAHAGAYTPITVQPPLLAAPVDTIDSLAEALATFGGSSTSIWHDRHQIVALLDNSDRRERVRLPLHQSQQFKALAALPKTFDQRGLVLFLKRVLAGAIDEGLLAIFRQIDFTKREEGAGTVKHGDESLGRSVHAVVRGCGEIPEFITVTTHVYANQDLRYAVTVRLSVDIDVTRGAIELTPLPDELENAILASQERIAQALAEVAPETATVFYGTPGFAEGG